MTYGLQIFSSAGNKTFDSTTASGGCIVDVVTLRPSGARLNTGVYVSAQQVKSYTIFTGRSAYVTTLGGQEALSPTVVIDNITYGYPVVTFAALNHFNQATPPETYMVFIL